MDLNELALLCVLSLAANDHDRSSTIEYAPLPTIEECVEQMESIWQTLPPLRADFIVYEDEVTLESLRSGKVAPWDIEQPRSFNEGNRGWISFYGDWYSYRYIRPDIRFDISEYPLEVRYDGHRLLKLNPVIDRVIEVIPRDEKMREDWVHHFILDYWHVNLVGRLGPSKDLQQFLLPTAFSRRNYTVIGWTDFEGVQCIEVQLPDEDYIWLAPEYSWNFVRRRWRQLYGDDRHPMWTETRHRNFVQFHGRYMPTTSIILKEESQQMARIHRLYVTGYSDVPSEEFRPIPAPGTMWTTIDPRKGTSTDKFTPGGDDKLEALMKRLRGRFESARGAQKQLRWISIYLGGFCAVLAAVVIGRHSMSQRRRTIWGEKNARTGE